MYIHLRRSGNNIVYHLPVAFDGIIVNVQIIQAKTDKYVFGTHHGNRIPHRALLPLIKRVDAFTAHWPQRVMCGKASGSQKFDSFQHFVSAFHTVVPVAKHNGIADYHAVRQITVDYGIFRRIVRQNLCGLLQA